MNKIILVRAGHTAWEETFPEHGSAPGVTKENAILESAAGLNNDQQRLQGTLSLPLSETGKEALKKVASLLQLEGVGIIYSSGNESSGPTADYLAELCRLKSRKVTRMHELDCGLWQGLRIKDIKQRYGRAYRLWREDPAAVCPPEGEPVVEAFKRVEASLKAIAKKNKNGTAVAIVAAPVVAAIIECIFLGRSLEDMWLVSDKNEPVQKILLSDTLVNGVPQGQLMAFDTPHCHEATA